jgi:hypothetical protein
MATKKFIPEILQEINDSPNVLESLKSYVDNETLKYTFAWAFIPKAKFMLPDGIPPYKPTSNPIGTTASNFAQEVRKFQMFLRTDMKRVHLEKLFIQLLEDLHPSESEVLICIKDQNLRRLYPNITLDLIVEAGFFTYPHIPEGYKIYVPEVKEESDFLESEDSSEESQPVSKETTPTTPKKGGRPKKETK